MAENEILQEIKLCVPQFAQSAVVLPLLARGMEVISQKSRGMEAISQKSRGIEVIFPNFIVAHLGGALDTHPHGKSA
jgi:hypothetical protein